MIHTVRSHNNSKAFIADAAASSLNKQILLRIKQEGDLTCINVVRKEDQAKLLREQFGQEYVLIEGSPTFKEDLKEAIAKVNPGVFFDCVGGGSPVVLPIFEALPFKSKMVIVANLSHQPVPIDTGHLMFTQKSIQGFTLFSWLLSVSHEERQKAFKTVAEDLGSNNGSIFGTNFTKELPLSQWEDAIKTYAEVASKEFGKILINCQP